MNHPTLKTFRKTLRNQLTPAEAALWRCLKGKQLQGRKFRRQHSIGRYIVDFYCPAEKLAIELDGEPHNNDTIALRDQERDAFLQHYGITVLRFENKQLFENADGVLAYIAQHFSNHPDASRHPSFKGGEQKQSYSPNIGEVPAKQTHALNSSPNIGEVAAQRSEGSLSNSSPSQGEVLAKPAEGYKKEATA